MTDSDWSVLGIEKTNDRREIKRAYARKLKSCRPDDDPAGFQRLHDAYQRLLSRAEHPDLFSVETYSVEIETANNSDSASETGDNRISSELAVKVDAAMERVMTVLDEPLYINNPGSWAFLSESTDLLDDDYRIALGVRVLFALAEYNHGIKASRRFDVVQPHIVGLLDSVFFWSSNPWQFIGDDFAEESLNLISQVDPGRAASPARPVGGDLIMSSEPPRVRPRKSEGTNWWQVFVIFWMVIMFVRLCSGAM